VSERRRLAAIVATDVVEFSRLMGIDESGTLAALKAHRADLIDPALADHGGRIVKTMGDGLLLEFPSVVEAVRFTIRFQEGMGRLGAGAPERELAYRIGASRRCHRRRRRPLR
jgi:adenylate cyclase